MSVPGPAPAIKTFTKDSINTLTITGATDGSGTSLTSANTTFYVTVTDWASGSSILAQTAMTYSGTAGKWTYDIAAAVWGTPYDDRYVLIQEYDQNGNSGAVRLTLDFLARAAG